MRHITILLTIVLFQNCSISAQKPFVLDQIPIDTSKWTATDTVIIKLDSDQFDDLVLVFDKYKKLVRPNGLQTPILIYKGNSDNDFKYFRKAEKAICLPEYKIEPIDGGFIITQNGVNNDLNLYINQYVYKSNNIIMNQESVEQVTTKLEIHKESGAFTQTKSKKNIYSAKKAISIEKYNCVDFISKFSSSK